MSNSIGVSPYAAACYCGSELQQYPLAAWEYLANAVDAFITSLISRIFYVGYEVISPDVAAQRTQALIDRGAYHIQSSSSTLDILYIPSRAPQRTGNALIIAENTTYPDIHPRRYQPYLDRGADIIIWNPSAPHAAQATISQYAQELIQVIQAVKSVHPQQRLAIHSYCASVEPALEAATHFQDPIALIVDRGQCDVHTLGATQTLLTKLPYISNILERVFSCGAMRKLDRIPGRICFLSPPIGQDQIMHYERVKNLTREIYERRRREDDRFFTLEVNSDHWSKWGSQTYNRAFTFLSENGILSAEFSPANSEQFPDPPPLSFFKKTLLPLLIKSPIDHLKGFFQEMMRTYDN